MEDLRGKRAIVTGAACGIGRGIASVLHELGVSIVGIDRDAEKLSALATAGLLANVHADLGSVDTEALGSRVCEEHGPIDFLVNNVGIDTPGGFSDLNPREFDGVFSTNLRGPWFLTKAVTADMLAARRSGAIVFVSSLHDHIIRTRPHYSTSKAAVAMLVKEMAQELGPHRIRVNAVSPGVVLSGTVTRSGSEGEARDRALIPLQRIGRPEDIGRAVAMLLSDAWCGYVTGANLPVDGGLGLHSWSVDPE